MAKYTFICEHDKFNGSGGSKHTLEFNEEGLNDVIEQFEMFLRGCGFYFTGNLDIAEDQLSSLDNDDEYGEPLILKDFDDLNDPYPFSDPTTGVSFEGKDDVLHVRV